jgi:hypothetical protein
MDKLKHIHATELYSTVKMNELSLDESKFGDNYQNAEFNNESKLQSIHTLCI